MLPDKVDAGWTKKAGEDGEEEQEERRKRKSKKKETIAANINPVGEKLTERDIYMINKGMEMEIKMRGRAGAAVGAVAGGGEGGGYRDLYPPSYPEYRLPDSLLYPQRSVNNTLVQMFSINIPQTTWRLLSESECVLPAQSEVVLPSSSPGISPTCPGIPLAQFLYRIISDRTTNC